MSIRSTEKQDVAIAPRRAWWKWGLLATLAALVFAFAASAIIDWSAAERSVDASRLRFATVQRGPFVRDTSAPASVVAANSPTLYSPYQGTVNLMVRAGDQVADGQLLMRLESPQLDSELLQERTALSGIETELRRLSIDVRQRQLAQRKQVDNAHVALKAAERELRRVEAGHQRRAVSELDLEKARDEAEKARLEYEHAVAEGELLADAVGFEVEAQQAAIERQRLRVQELERRQAQLEVRSPVTGMVGNILVDPRAVVSENQPLMMVVDLTAFELEAQVPESYADALTPGTPAEVRVNGDTHAAVVAGVSPEVRNGQVQARLRFSGPTPEGLRQNQRLTARLIFDERDGIVYVPRGGFFDSGGGRSAYVLTEGGIAERRRISTGATSVDKIEILSGLEPGERIVSSNTDAFQDAERVFLND